VIDNRRDDAGQEPARIELERYSEIVVRSSDVPLKPVITGAVIDLGQRVTPGPEPRFLDIG
jgi:hypothetical protein